MDQIAGVLQSYEGGKPQAEQDVAGHYEQVAQAAPKEDLADGVAAAFRSEQTPPFSQMVSQLFGQSGDQERAGLLNTLLASGAGSGILAQLAAAAGISLPANAPGATPPQVTPEMAGKVSPEAVRQAAENAEKQDPSIVDRVSSLYAQHPALFRTLGATALSLAMSHMANRRRR